MTPVETAICYTVLPAVEYTRLQITRGIVKDNSLTIRMSLNILEYFFQKNAVIERYDFIDQKQLDDVSSTKHKAKIYYKFVDKFVDDKIVKATYLILVADISDTPCDIVDLIGPHNRKIFLKSHFNNLTDHKVIVPFELTTFLFGPLGNVNRDFAFINNPLHPVFITAIKPVPIMGVAVGGKIDRIIGYVSDPASASELFFQATDNLTQSRLEFDTKLALNLLKCEYSVKVSDKVLQSLTVYDDFIKKNAAKALANQVGD